MEITVVCSEDWDGLYIDGKLELEGHSIHWRDLVDVLRKKGLPIYIKNPPGDASGGHLAEWGRYPEKLEEVTYEYT